LDRGGLALEPLGEPFGGEARAERLDAKALEQGGLVEPLGRNEIHIAEAARIGITNRGAVAEMEHDMLVLRRWLLRMRECAELTVLIDREAPGHAEMRHEHLAAAEPGN